MVGFRNIVYYFLLTLGFIGLTVLTQIGGFILLFAVYLNVKRIPKFWGDKAFVFILLYDTFTFLIVPIIAPIFGREPIKNTEHIKPTTFFTVLCNRNYVQPAINQALQSASETLIKEEASIQINYLDANFPFFNGFPLLPHLSHNDGKKLDLSFVYENESGQISPLQKSNSGYGIFTEPLQNEINQTQICKDNGYWQYNYSKYLTLGEINTQLSFSEKGTKLLINALLQDQEIGKLFIEPHLKQRLQLTDDRIRFHGCGAVRHDDHIHFQLL
ncbi:MAG: hypothetical protein RLZZ337_1455 [Bacteroidota bacterium]